MTQSSASPHSLLLVRSTLEVSSLLKSLYPALNGEVERLEQEVVEAGQLLLDAGAVARARLALERIHGVRLTLQEMEMEQQQQSLQLAA